MRTRDLKVGKFYQIVFTESVDISCQFIGPALLLVKDDNGKMHKFNTGFEIGWFGSEHVKAEVPLSELFQFE